MNNAVFGKSMENARTHRDIKLVTTEEEIIWCQNQTIIRQGFSQKILAKEMKNTETLLNKPVCLGFLILELSKILMYEFDMIM